MRKAGHNPGKKGIQMKYYYATIKRRNWEDTIDILRFAGNEYHSGKEYRDSYCETFEQCKPITRKEAIKSKNKVFDKDTYNSLTFPEDPTTMLPGLKIEKAEDYEIKW